MYERTFRFRMMPAVGLSMMLAGLVMPAVAMAEYTLLQQLTGNTLSLPATGGNGAAAHHYLANDGTGWRWRTGAPQLPESIRWFMYSDGRLCITPVMRGHPPEEDCARYTLDGGKATLQDAQGGLQEGQLRRDDPEHLQEKATGKAPLRLAGAAAIERIVGNTLQPVAIGSRSGYGGFHLLPGGKGAFVKDEASFGNDVGQITTLDLTWRVDAQQSLCTTWPSGEVCESVSLVDDQVLLRSLDSRYVMPGIVHASDLLNLSPENRQRTARLRQSLVGNTLVVEPHNAPGTLVGLYLAIDGTGMQLRGSPGKWALASHIGWMLREDRELLCLRSHRRGQPATYTQDDCQRVEVDGNTLRLRHGQAQALGRIVQGRPVMAD